MMDVLPHLPWHLAAGLAVLVLVGLALRRRGGKAAVAGAIAIWLAFALAAAWVVSSLRAALVLLHP